jgi:N-formylglutamate deformylase
MRLPFLITLPHCSNRIPERLRSVFALTDEQIRESADLGTKEIFGSIPTRAVLCAKWSRLVVDLNRGPHQRGPKGVIAQKDYHGRTVYSAGCIPDEAETQRRLKKYYFPFHKRVREVLERRDIIGLFDCHSLNATGPAEAPDPGKKRKDIVLGNNGDKRGNTRPALGRTTCPAQAIRSIKAAFERAHFSVDINYPYAGGFITTHYSQEFRDTGKMAVQIEINQDLYLDPTSMRPIPEKLERVKRRVLQSFQEVAHIPPQLFVSSFKLI